MIKLNEKFLSPFVRANEVAQMEAELGGARKTVMDKSGAGSDFLGWLDLPVDYDKEEFARIRPQPQRFRRAATFSLSSVSAVLISVRAPQSNS